MNSPLTKHPIRQRLQSNRPQRSAAVRTHTTGIVPNTHDMPTLEYFPVRGRAEVIRIALAYKGVELEEKGVDLQQMKSDLYIDGEVSIVQSNSIIRFIARKYDLAGTTESEMCMVDMVLEGVESLRSKYLGLIYTDALADEPKANYWASHGDKAGTAQRNGGAHLEYLAAIVRSNPAGLTAGSAVTVADLAVFEIVDIHNRIFAKEMEATYPELLALHAKVEALDGVKKYRSSDRLCAKVNGNSLG